MDSLLKTQAPTVGPENDQGVGMGPRKPRCARRQRVWVGQSEEKQEQISLLKLRADKQTQLNLK